LTFHAKNGARLVYLLIYFPGLGYLEVQQNHNTMWLLFLNDVAVVPQLCGCCSSTMRLLFRNDVAVLIKRVELHVVALNCMWWR
jgi:hypothetical protein